jgi:RND superfamily putative drug exporter
MAMFFTPSLTALIGHAAWWPGHADRDTGSVLESGRAASGAGLDSGSGSGSGSGSAGGDDAHGAELDETGRR